MVGATAEGGVGAVRAALRSCWPAFVGVGLTSGVANLLMLTGSFFMLEVYDRVLPSRSIPTLVGLVAIAAFLFAVQAGIDTIRSRIMVRVGTYVDARLSVPAYRAGVLASLRSPEHGAAPVRDLDLVRSFLQGGGPIAFFDLPWLPLYGALCFAFHPWIGLAVVAGVALLIVPTLLTGLLTRGPVARANASAARRAHMSEASRRTVDVLVGSGMLPRMEERWRVLSEGLVAENQRAADIAGGFGALSKAMRMALQSAVLAVGALLVIREEATAGIIIASSILSARALAPVEQLIAHWKGFVAARQAAARLGLALPELPADRSRTALPAPTSSLLVERLSVGPPGSARLVVRDVSFALNAGQGLAIIGPSGSGKSSLLRALVGVWARAAGHVRIDGATLEQWGHAVRHHVGYVPQDVELLAGTVAQNIARFEDPPDHAAVVAAARAAGAHEMIVTLPDGYETEVGENGGALSAGQRQRVALARALYGDPFLVILDEPNSNLDVEGEAALTTALLGVRARGGIVVVVAHRPTALAAVDTVLVMGEGTARAFGTKEAVIGAISHRAEKITGAAGRSLASGSAP